MEKLLKILKKMETELKNEMKRKLKVENTL